MKRTKKSSNPPKALDTANGIPDYQVGTESGLQEAQQEKNRAIWRF
jgi:hypothetical protein